MLARSPAPSPLPPSPLPTSLSAPTNPSIRLPKRDQRAFETLRQSLILNVSTIMTEKIPAIILKLKELEKLFPSYHHDLQLQSRLTASLPISSITGKSWTSDRYDIENFDSENINSNSDHKEPMMDNNQNQHHQAADDALFKKGHPVYAGYFDGHPLIPRYLAQVQSSLFELTLLMKSLSVGIQLNVPELEETSNYGLDIQNQALAIVSSTLAGLRSRSLIHVRYHGERAGLIAKIIKHPTIVEFRLAVTELDERYWQRLSFGVKQMIGMMYSLYDMLKKNEERLLDPKGQQYHLRML